VSAAPGRLSDAEFAERCAAHLDGYTPGCRTAAENESLLEWLITEIRATGRKVRPESEVEHCAFCGELIEDGEPRASAEDCTLFGVLHPHCAKQIDAN